MALEPITRQEKIIAGQDLTPITRMEKFLKQFGGGAQADWNVNDESDPAYVRNRPFYDDERVKVSFPHGDMTFVKVSDGFPSGELSDGATYTVWRNDGESGESSMSMSLTKTSEEIFVLGGSTPFAIFILSDNVEIESLLFPERGTYFAKINANGYSFYVSGIALGDAGEPEITWDGNIGGQKPIDPKFLPEYVRNNGFLVNVSFDYVDGAGVYTADATYADIEAASNDGINVRAQLEGTFYTLHEVRSGIAKFYYIQASDTSTKSCTIKWLEFSESGVTGHFIVLNVNQ